MASLLDVVPKRLFHMEVDGGRPVKKVVTGSDVPLDVEIRTQQREPEPNADQHQGADPRQPGDLEIDQLICRLERRRHGR